MGNQSYREQMFQAIEKGQIDKIYAIYERYPQILDEDLAKDVKVTPLARAVWRCDYDLTDRFIKMGAKVDNGGSDTITPLMWAAKRDQAYLVSNILDYGADVTLVSNEGFTALDYAIIHGNYRPALFLYHFYQTTKEIMDYYQFAQSKDYRYVNYEVFLAHLKNKVDYQQVPNVFKKPEKKKLLDPVIDPREPWKKMVTRLIEFEDPPMIERSSLPLQLQPQNRVLGRVRSYLNGIDPYPSDDRLSQRNQQIDLDQENIQLKEDYKKQQHQQKKSNSDIMGNHQSDEISNYSEQ